MHPHCDCHGVCLVQGQPLHQEGDEGDSDAERCEEEVQSHLGDDGDDDGAGIGSDLRGIPIAGSVIPLQQLQPMVYETKPGT